MLTMSSHKGNANQNHTKIPPHPYWNRHHQEHHHQQMLARICGKKYPHMLLVGMQSSTTTLENNMEVSYKIKHRSALYPSNPTPRDIPKVMQFRLLQRHLHTHVYCSTIHNNQVMETAKMLHY
jgi:hypothetical protein